MDWNTIKGNWKQLRGKAKQQWGELTDDDLDKVDGKQTELVGRIQERYGKSRQEAEREVKQWAEGQSEMSRETEKSRSHR